MQVSVIDPDGSGPAELVVSLPGADQTRQYADGNGVLVVMTSHNPKETT